MTAAFLPFLAPLTFLFIAFHASRTPGLRPGRIPQFAENAAIGVMAIATASVFALIASGPGTSGLIGAAGLGLAVRLDTLSVILLMLVSFVGWVVLRFAATYMDGEPRQGAFTAWLCATLAAVLLLVTAGNLLQLVIAWIATSAGLNRLLLHYPERLAAKRAARKKFVTARLGDASLLLAAILLYNGYGTGDIAEILSAARMGEGHGVAVWVAALLSLAALLKSAQFPAHGWLTEVMETPTPVSALLHAGVINAGGFLLIRFADVMLLAPGVLAVLVIIGGFTALFGGLVMLTQSAVKTSLAWSTVAQMGFMILQCGLALFPLALLHIVAHSLYKAHAFLASGMAVEGIAGLRRPGPVAIPSGRAVLRAFLIAFSIYALVGWLFGFSDKSAQAIALGAILIFGVAYLLAQGLAGAAPRALTQRTVVYSLAATVGYFVLHGVTQWLMYDTLPVTPAPGPLEWALIVLSLLSFAVVAVAQSMFPLWAYHPAAAGLRVHLSNGLYANAVFDRLLGGWSSPKSKMLAGDVDSSLPLLPESLSNAANAAARAIPPMWPLSSSVAVNPFLGQTDKTLADTGARLARVSGASITMPREWYLQQIDNGQINDTDLSVAIACAPEEFPFKNITELKTAATTPVAAAKPLPTVADLAAKASGIDWPGILADRFGMWAAGYFDEGQALWAATRDRNAYLVWKQAATHDLTPEIVGLQGFAQFVADAPDTAERAMQSAASMLDLSDDSLDTYLHQLLLGLGGWSQYARYRLWEAELADGSDDTITDLLAIRLLWEAALYSQYKEVIASEWHGVLQSHAQTLTASRDLQIDTLLQSAAEHAAHRELAAGFAKVTEPTASRRPAMQAAFCIDVRSEVFRRSLESVNQDIQTLGFAGFFGLTAAHQGFASDVVEKRLPVLLNPGVKSVSGDASTADVANADLSARLEARARRAWGRFKLAAVSSFAFVEAAGPIYVSKLLRDSLQMTPRAVPNDPAPRLDPGMDNDASITAAESILRAMSLTSNFAPLVIIAGHGANVVNNPYASAMHCGACGGYSGEVNARLLATLLNDANVRHGLESRGISIPADTLVIAALHDTTTDKVTLYNADQSTQAHIEPIRQARQWLQNAGRISRAERALRLPRANHEGDIDIRSRDWAEVRPEWALAGCQAFVAAPRHRTSSRNLAGRAFLHDYHWEQDNEFGVLELIMTAPVVVASWISLQYYGSTVAPQLFGGGNKLLHNIVGGIGVVEGNGGVLRNGLPMQSIHDGDKFMHVPLRLAVCIEAPIEAMNAILERHDNVRALFDNHWLYLFAMDEQGQLASRYSGALEWSAMKE